MNGKKLAILTIIGLLVLGGAGFGYYTMKMNAESFRGIEVSVKGVEDEEVESWVSAFSSALKGEDVLKAIAEKSDYANTVGISEGEAVQHLREAIKVKRSMPRRTIQIGLNGKRKQNTQLDEISRVILGLAAPVVATQNPSFGAYYNQQLENR